MIGCHYFTSVLTTSRYKHSLYVIFYLYMVLRNYNLTNLLSTWYCMCAEDWQNAEIVRLYNSWITYILPEIKTTANTHLHFMKFKAYSLLLSAIIWNDRSILRRVKKSLTCSSYVSMKSSCPCITTVWRQSGRTSPSIFSLAPAISDLCSIRKTVCW